MKTDAEGLTLDDLREQHREYAELIGLDNLLKLADTFGGTSIYIPQKRELVKNKVYAAIHKEFDGSNLLELTRKYGVSKSMVYKIVRDKAGHCSQGIPGQMSLADWIGDRTDEN